MVPLPDLNDAQNFAFFFDFDGTLTELAETPSGVILEDRARQALSRLLQTSSGAVAIVTGREIESIDAYLSPLHLPAAGVHGFERRNGSGTVCHRGRRERCTFPGKNSYVLRQSQPRPSRWKRNGVPLHCITASGRSLRIFASRSWRTLRQRYRKPCLRAGKWLSRRGFIQRQRARPSMTSFRNSRSAGEYPFRGR